MGGKQHIDTSKNILKNDFGELPLIFREHGSSTRLAKEKVIAAREFSIYKKWN